MPEMYLPFGGVGKDHEKIPKPFHTLHIDQLGPLPSLKSKRKHLLVVVDAFTKFVKLYAVNGTTTKEPCYAVAKYFDAYSRPKQIICDQGTCFTSAEFARYVEKSDIAHIKAGKKGH